MPIYEYECAFCGHRLEALQKLSEAPLNDCPECGKPALHKLISAAGFRLKGGGWYETDFKSGGKRHLADGGKEQPAADAKSGDAKDKDKDKKDSKETKSPAADKPAAADKATKPKDSDKPAKAASP